jgi:hypothetical protein
LISHSAAEKRFFGLPFFAQAKKGNSPEGRKPLPLPLQLQLLCNSIRQDPGKASSRLKPLLRHGVVVAIGASLRITCTHRTG